VIREAIRAALWLVCAAVPAAAAPAASPTFASGAAETDPAVHIARAASDYEAGRITDALAAYERLAARYPGDAAVAYNLGNCHWRLNRRARAIAWYERARRLSPRDADIRFNLAIARAHLADEEPSWWETADRVLTAAELAWLAAACLWTACLGAGWALLRGAWSARLRIVVMAAATGCTLAAGWLGLRLHDLRQPWAVVAVPTAEVRSGPGDQFPVGYTAPEGQRTLILNRRPGWVEIGIPARSLKGWVADSVIEAI
jgi:hypothetical protein